jgi:DNA-binding CsgD family transcriptional regulator/tetratricopeptide (TPR) repeat protein
VALFIERAQAVKPDFQVTNANAPAVAEICIRLDGLPLAIELAAARIRLFPPQAILTRLGQRLPLLTSNARDVPARQQTLRQTIQWSYDLLTVQERRLFRRLSVFAGGCSWQAVEAVAADWTDETTSVLDAVSSLVDKNLLQQMAQEGEDIRLTMLETIREFGLEVLTSAGEAEVIKQTHAHFFLALAEQAEPELQGPNQVLWAERLEQEHDNLRAVLEWALEDVADERTSERRGIALRLSAALGHFWWMRGYYSEARTFLERALARSEKASVSLRVKVLQTGANVSLYQGDYARGEALAEQSLALNREQGNTRGIADCLGLLVHSAMVKGKTAEAIALSEERVRLMRQVGEPGEVAESLYDLAQMLNFRGELARAQALYEEALLLYRKAGNDLGVAATLIQSAIGLWWHSLGDAATIQTIRHRLQEGQAIVSKLGSRNLIGLCSWGAALVALSEGETARAETLVQESLAIYLEIGNRWNAAWALHILGRVEAQRNDLTAARSWYQQSLALTQELGDKFVTPHNLEGLAAVLVAQGELTGAAHLWGAAEALREEIDVPLELVDRAGYEQAVAFARTHLGEQAFAAAWAEGRSMTLKQVLGAPGPAEASIQASTEQPSTSTAKPSPTYSNGLTAREVEVLRLVAKGLTDAQIAAHLVISPRTVNNHLTSIYGKIQVSSRAAATRYAIEHHLV